MDRLIVKIENLLDYLSRKDLYDPESPEISELEKELAEIRLQSYQAGSYE